MKLTQPSGVVIDSSIFIKLLILETDSNQAQNLINHLALHKIPILEPELFYYEILSCISRTKLDPKKCISILNNFEKGCISYIKPDINIFEIVNNITNNGHKKSGYPSFYDSVYHAIAIYHNYQFITADEKHYNKTKQLGNISLLKDAVNIFNINATQND